MNVTLLKRIIIEEREHAQAAGVEFNARFLVMRARDAGHPLHEQLWLASEADLAMAQRLTLASELIRRVPYIVVDRDQGRISVPYYVHSPSKKEYVPVMELRDQREMAMESMLSELQLLAGVRTRVLNLALVLDLRVEVDMALSGLDELMLLVQAAREKPAPTKPKGGGKGKKARV